MPTQDQVLSIVRWCITAVCGAAVTRGYLSEDLTEGIIGAVLAVASLAWAFYAHNATNTIKATTRLNPDVKVVVPTAAEDSSSHADMALSKAADDPSISQVVWDKK